MSGLEGIFMANVKGNSVIIDPEALQSLFDGLKALDYALVGPTVRDGAIVYDEVEGVGDLPAGWTDEQAPGVYHLKRRGDDALFGYAVGPHAWKRYLHPPTQSFWRAHKRADGVEIIEESPDEQKRAFIGVRACELAAMQIQDRVFTGGDYKDEHYAVRRANSFIIAVNCGAPAGTCFCVSMGHGPEVKQGYDLALTELLDDGVHKFLVQPGSQAGRNLLADIEHREAAPDELAAAAAVISASEANMGRALETDGLRDVLMENLEHPHWDEVAERCLSCANCTMVCPTCFCTSVEDSSDLTGLNSERSRRWDSCFSMDHSYLTGGSVHRSVKSRYRQWLTHKLATWIDQFGETGCVGCGRCITWCPAGIDITEEVNAIRNSSG